MKRVWVFIALLGLSALAIFIYVNRFHVGDRFFSQAPKEIKVAFIGDEGLGQGSRKVLELIKSERADLILFQGDFDITDNPEAWDNQLNSVLGPSFPIIAAIGNHDVKKWSEYRKKIIDRIKSIPDLYCRGDGGVRSLCTYHNVTVVTVAPGIFPDNYASFIQTSFASISDSWKICSWHKNQHLMQTGDKQDETGWDVYESCRNQGAFIVTGHEHVYERTFLLSNFRTQQIVSTSSVLNVRPGQSFAVVSGLGGQSIRPQKISGPWWASVYTRDQGADFGALFCTFNTENSAKKAHCYFKDISGKIPDQFDIVR